MHCFSLVLLFCAMAIKQPSVHAFLRAPPIHRVDATPCRPLRLHDCGSTIDAVTSLWISNHQDEADKALWANFPSAGAAVGSSLIMLTIVGLLFLWDEAVEWLRETVPKALLPVVEAILAEIGGLGFIGLILGSVLGNGTVKENLEGISIAFFGEGDILVENFEFLHSAFFQVGVGFFVAAGAMTAVGIQKLNEVETVEGLELDAGGSCVVTPETISRYIPKAEERRHSNMLGSPVAGGNTLWDEVVMKKEERAGRVLLMRLLFKDRPDTFRIEEVIESSFAHNLRKMVKISPATWIYLIPALSLANAVDLSNDVINSSSPNAAESVGYFFSTPSALFPSILTVTLSIVWGLWNCWKLTQIKYMMMPRLETNSETENIEILPPLCESKPFREAFDSSISWVKPIESIWAKPAVTPLDELFGTAGAAGMDVYQNSIKYQAWLCITHIVFFGTQIVPRDISAWWSHASVGNPEYFAAELFTYSFFILVSLFQLLLISPRSFWNYCLIYASPFWDTQDTTQSCNLQ